MQEVPGPERSPSNAKPKLAACDPCRLAKQACDHTRPVCLRCSRSKRAGDCVYREAPFKKRKKTRGGLEQSANGLLLEPQSVEIPTQPEHSSQAPTQPRYPNPGFLGCSSHSAIFDQMPAYRVPSSIASVGSNISQPGVDLSAVSSLRRPQSNELIGRAARSLKLLYGANILQLEALVRTWLSKGANLPLAEPFVGPCASTVLEWKRNPTTQMSFGGDNQDPCSALLMGNTSMPMVLSDSCTLEEVLERIVGPNIRWEVIGIFASAAARALMDVPEFPTLFTTEQERRSLTGTLLFVGDFCLEICLSFDCLNDMQLILQYENFIVNSRVHGYQSFYTWRMMGDLTSSLFSLGYHELPVNDGQHSPPFMAQLRKAVFARVYAGDKNLAVFLGRPPRIIKSFCNFQLPAYTINTEEESSREIINYTADTRCSAIFASFKERLLELLRHRDHRNREVVSMLRVDLEKQWRELPAQFRLTTTLDNCHCSPFERDFLAGTRLDYLHTHFLLGLVELRQTPRPNERVLGVATEMLALVLETILLQARLVNSGTSLIWKIAHYGLPAAGILCISLVRSLLGNMSGVSRSRMIQHLCVFVAQVQCGAIVQPEDPNYVLFMRASQAIRSLLDSAVTWDSQASKEPSNPPQNTDSLESWDPYVNLDPWEFELDFWDNLAAHSDSFP